MHNWRGGSWRRLRGRGGRNRRGSRPFSRMKSLAPRATLMTTAFYLKSTRWSSIISTHSISGSSTKIKSRAIWGQLTSISWPRNHKECQATLNSLSNSGSHTRSTGYRGLWSWMVYSSRERGHKRSIGSRRRHRQTSMNSSCRVSIKPTYFSKLMQIWPCRLEVRFRARGITRSILIWLVRVGMNATSRRACSPTIQFRGGLPAFFKKKT